MKAKVFVQALNVMDSHVVGVGKVTSVTLAFADQDEAVKAGLAPQSSIMMTVKNAAGFLPGSEHTIEIRPAK